LALKRAAVGSISHVQCEEFQRRAGGLGLELSHSSLERGAFLLFFVVCNSSFHALLREKSSSLFMLLGWSLTSTASLMMCSKHLVFIAKILLS